MAHILYLEPNSNANANVSKEKRKILPLGLK